MKKYITVLLGVLLVFCMVTACGKSGEKGTAEKKAIPVDKSIAENLEYQYRVPLQYAEQFALDCYGEGYMLLTITDGNRFLVVDEDKDIPGNMEKDITVIHGKLHTAYLVATAAMDMFVHLNALDCIRLAGTDVDGWYIEEARQAMQAGDILYAGKYNAPDYERILSQKCDFAIESTMILHNPEVKEKLESFGIPVLVDYASYESHPLGRMEWVKVYGVLTGQYEEAVRIFEQETSALDGILGQTQKVEQEEKTVAFFYITSNGAVNVRKSSDYIPKMIDMAGGAYIFKNSGGEDNHTSSTTMQMEEFYASAKDADYLIYNSSVDTEIRTIDELLDKSSLLADFKAVQNGNVWCATKNLYQESMSTATLILDLNRMLTEENVTDEGMHYLQHLQ